MALEKYHFTAGDGTKIDVHYLNDKLSFKAAKKLRKEHGNNNEALADAFMEAALTSEELDKVENLSLRDYGRFMTGWMESEEVEPGES